MGLGDKIRGAIETAIGAAPVNKALGTTSGLDAAMQAHADEKHPVASPPMFPPKPKYNPNPP